jgi:hypothetical protein
MAAPAQTKVQTETATAPMRAASRDGLPGFELILLAILALFLKAMLAVGAMVSGPLLLADDTKKPHVVVSWPTTTGSGGQQGTITLEADRAYGSPGMTEPLGKNLACYVGLGGTRVDRGAGHPLGAVARVGLYKRDTGKLLFEDLADGAMITVKVTNVHFNQSVVPRPKTVIQHVKYLKGDIDACGLGTDAMDQFNTFDPKETLNGKAVEPNVRPGILDGHDPAMATVTVKREEDGSVSLTAVFAYQLLRHIRDPWLRTTPGGFFEPNHFHIEFEVVPESVAAAEDVAEKATAEERPQIDADGRRSAGDGEQGLGKDRNLEGPKPER